MDLGLSGKRALVLSSSSGLGLGIAKGLAAEGAKVLLTGRNADRLAAETATLNAARAGSADFVAADLAAEDGIDRILERAGQFLQTVDILVNNTGGPPARIASEVTASDWQTNFRAMVMPVTEITRRLLPAMRQQGFGRILTVASSGVVQPIGNLAISNALRSSIVSWSKTLSGEVAAAGITVNVLLPGRIQTARVEQLDTMAAEKAGLSKAEIVRASEQTIPAGRYGTVEEFAAMAVFLASVPASYVTGSVIRVDGGMIRAV